MCDDDAEEEGSDLSPRGSEGLEGASDRCLNSAPTAPDHPASRGAILH